VNVDGLDPPGSQSNVRFRSRRPFAIAVWPALIALAAGSARGQVVQRDDDEPSPGHPRSVAPPAPAPAAAAPPTVRRPRIGLVIGGVALFAATWVPTLLLSRTGGGCDDQRCRDSFDVLWFPVLGPVLAYDKNSNFSGVLAVVWTLAEAGGLVVAIAGLRGREVPVDPPATSSWRISPTLSPVGAGLSVGATF
jgi:hypothetical protein